MFQLRNTPIPQGSISVARESLPVSDAMQGLGAMNQPNAGMFNADDGGAMSKPYVNAQPTENAFLAAQRMQQDAITAAPQQAAAAMGMVKKQQTEMDNAGYKAQTMLNERMVQELVKRGSGGALMEMGAIMQSPEKQRFLNDIETGSAMFNSQAPELGAAAAQSMQYS